MYDTTVERNRFYNSRASSRTEQEREDHFQAWLNQDRDRELWTDDVDRLREFFMRRYTKPAAPEL